MSKYNINEINITHAKVHNLKSLSLTIPKNSLTVITGPSGSGKSSLAFDTIYAEGQRRYIESLSSYARQFLEQFSSAEVDSITGLSPTLAIDQKTINKNPRSTVGTITEIYDYLRILYTRTGKLYCPECHQRIERQSAEQIVNSILKQPAGTKIQLLAPIVSNRKGEHREELVKLLPMGFSRIRIDKEFFNLDHDLTEIKITKNQKHNIEVVIDRVILKDGIRSRLNDSVEQTLKLGKRSAIAFIEVTNQVQHQHKNFDILFNENNFCTHCDLSFPELTPSSFSFNSPLGACPECDGLGVLEDFLDELIIQNPALPMNQGGIPLLTKKHSFLFKMITCVADQDNINLDNPIRTLPKKFIQTILYGSKKSYSFSFISENSHFKFNRPFIGLHAWLRKRFYETNSEKIRSELQSYIKTQGCKSCQGHRLNKYALATKIAELSIMEYCDLSVSDAFQRISTIEQSLSSEDSQIASKPLKEIRERLSFLLNVGLGYLTLNRNANTLAGGEGQRIRLATQIGSSLSGVIYVLDEPSIGLHARDNERLIRTLTALRDLGNTVLVVEHDEETIRKADHIIDMGPGAGTHGGEIVAEGTLSEILMSEHSLTGKFLSGREFIPMPSHTRTPNLFLSLKNIQKNNIHKLDVQIPLHIFACVTGVSGSGKSTLIHDVLVPTVREQLKKNQSGFQTIQNIIELDQAPIGRTPKSNPATYSGVFDFIRTVFSETLEAKSRGYRPGRFSFNVKGGRCEGCEGSGVKKIEMHFLPDVFITCHECQGKRYNHETLSVLYKGKNIYDLLNTTVEEAHIFFQNYSKINRILKTLIDVGLGYMKLGQPATTLSGGEAQRLKLATELARPAKTHCLYVLDGPTTGLHLSDVKILLESIHRLVDNGHSVLVIEHNLEVIKTADYIIDLGPEGGSHGGKIVASGTPLEVSKNPNSYTGQAIKKFFL